MQEWKIDEINILEQKNLEITRIFLMKDLFKICFDGTTIFSSFLVFIPVSPSICSSTWCPLSLQMRSAVAQSFSVSAWEWGWGVGKLQGATLVYKRLESVGEQGMGLAQVCAWQPCHGTWEKTSMGSCRLKAASCTPGISREDRAPQTLILASTQACLLHAQHISACLYSPRQLTILESHGSKSAEPNSPGSAWSEIQLAQP